MTINNKSERNYRGKCLGWPVTSYGNGSRKSLLFLTTSNEKFYRRLKCTIFSVATRSLFQNVLLIKGDWIGSLSVISRPGKWLQWNERLFKIKDSPRRRNPSVSEIPRLIKSFQTQRRMRHGKLGIVTRDLQVNTRFWDRILKSSRGS